jgi:hypothetical protein
MISTSTTKTTVQTCQLAVGRSERRSLSAMVITPRQARVCSSADHCIDAGNLQSDRKRGIECRVRAIDHLGVPWTAARVALIIERAMVTTTQRLAARLLAFDVPAEIHRTCRRLAQGRVGRTLIKEADSRLVLTVMKGGRDRSRGRLSRGEYDAANVSRPLHRRVCGTQSFSTDSERVFCKAAAHWADG